MFNTQQMLTIIKVSLSGQYHPVPKRNVALVGLDSVPAPQDAEVGMLEQKESPSKEQVGKSFLL